MVYLAELLVAMTDRL